MGEYECRECSGTIIFRELDGKTTPIHIDGGWCSGASSGTVTKVAVTEEVAADCVRWMHGPCPGCGDPILRGIHDEGEAWIGNREWPWSEHWCKPEQGTCAVPHRRTALDVLRGVRRGRADSVLCIVCEARRYDTGHTMLTVLLPSTVRHQALISGGGVALAGRLAVLGPHQVTVSIKRKRKGFARIRLSTA